MLTADKVTNKMAKSRPDYDPMTLKERPENWPTDPVAYLESKGWRYDGASDVPNPAKRWHDPNTGGTSKKVKVGERVFDGGRYKESVYQTHGPAADWWYSLEEAVKMQIERDQHERVTK